MILTFKTVKVKVITQFYVYLENRNIYINRYR